MLIRGLLFIIIVLMSLSTSAQATFKKSGNEVVFTSPGKTLKIEFCTPTMFRVRQAATNTFESNEPWMVVKYDCSPLTITTTESKDLIKLQTSALTIIVQKSSLAIDVVTKDGKLLSSETVAGGGVSIKGEAISCVKKL